jgi:hypothetical protein
MDPTTAIRTDTLPAVATLVIPGAVASGPYLMRPLLWSRTVPGYLYVLRPLSFARAGLV